MLSTNTVRCGLSASAATTREVFTHLLWPARCVACTSFVPVGDAFCELCRLSVFALSQSCVACAMPQEFLGHWCPTCAASRFRFSRAFAPLAYGGVVAEAVLRLKHGRHREVARGLGKSLAPALVSAATAGVDVVLPVPLHPRRLRQRGFNQALDLLWSARDEARSAEPARSLPQPALWVDVLRRVTDTPALGHESPQVRRDRVRGAFALSKPGVARGLSFLVVDDVMTTGATLDACACTLIDAGASDVRVAAVARAI